jgi:hypothetical protein
MCNGKVGKYLLRYAGRGYFKTLDLYQSVAGMRGLGMTLPSYL